MDVLREAVIFLLPQYAHFFLALKNILEVKINSRYAFNAFWVVVKDWEEVEWVCKHIPFVLSEH